MTAEHDRRSAHLRGMHFSPGAVNYRKPGELSKQDMQDEFRRAVENTQALDHRASESASASNGHQEAEDASPRCLGAGCIMHEPTGACPLCDEDGADRIAQWIAERHPQ